MTVGAVLQKIQDIQKLIDAYDKGTLNADHFDDLIFFIEEYKAELMKKKIAQ